MRAATTSPGFEKRKRGRPPGLERRQQILEATLGLVAQRGVDSTTITRIASAVGVTEGALYRHFDSREDILRAAGELLGERLRQWITAPSNPNVLERLREISQSHAPRMLEDAQSFLVPAFAFIVANPDLGLRQAAREGHLQFVNMLAEIIDEGKVQGSIRADVASELVAWQFMRLAWAEDFCSLLGLEQSANADVSAHMLDRILADIAAPGYQAPPSECGVCLESTEGEPERQRAGEHWSLAPAECDQ